MKSVRTCLWLAVVMIAAPLCAQDVEIVNGHKAVAHEVLVKFRDEANPRLRSVIDRQYGIRSMHGLGHGLMHLRSASGQTVARMIELLSADPDIEFAEPNYLVNIAESPSTVPPNDPQYAGEWGLNNTGQTGGIPHADIDAPAAWTITTGSRNVVVGVVDTGIDYTHPDLAANIWSASTPYTIAFGPGAILSCPAGSHGYDAITNTCDPMDQHNHGTHVAGTIGAVGNNNAGVTGVNWTVTIVGLRFLDANGSGTTANAIRAIEAGVQIKQAFPSQANIRILSNSWGGSGYSQALLQEIKRAGDAGILFVAAAGNNGADIGSFPSYPAGYAQPNEISVAATDSSDTLASFSNYSSTLVDIGAPGVDVLSTLRGGTYGKESGTSMATPHVSGAAALVLSACPTLSVADLKQTLLTTADPIPALAFRTTTGSRLNVYRAVHACASAGTPGVALTATPSALTLAPGGVAVSSVTVAGHGGFKGSVGFWVAGLPAGVTASFKPVTVVAGGATLLTLTAAANAPAVNTTVTVWASDGKSLTGSFAVALTVTPAPTFTLLATPSSQDVRQGYSGVVKISAAATSGFTGGVTLQVAGIPPYSSVSWGQAASGSLTMTVTTTKLTPVGPYPITITGTAGALHQQVAVTVNVTK